MKVRINKVFYLKLEHQVRYIAADKPQAANRFRKDILEKIGEIPSRPMSYKKSDFFDDAGFREMIFKGYRIVFEIRENFISVFGFHKWEDDLKK